MQYPALFASLSFFFSFSVKMYSQAVTVTSPDKQTSVRIELDKGVPRYSVLFNDVIMLENSPLGLKTNEGDFSSGLTFTGSKDSSISKNYTQEKIKKSSVNYLANVLFCSFENAQKRKMNIVFQVSDFNIAFRYELATMGPRFSCVVEKEATGYRFPSATTTFLSPMMTPMTGFARTAPSYESSYQADAPMPAAKAAKDGFVFPALFRIGDKGWILLSETGVSGLYCGAHLSDYSAETGMYQIEYPDARQNNGFGGNGAAISLPGVTPWRTITVGKSLKPIVESTVAFDVVEPLYEASIKYKYGRSTSVLFQNPVQMFGLTPNNLTDVPAFEIEFMKTVPTTWSETIYIDGYPGKYVVIARRHGTEWYIAGVNAMKELLNLTLSLPMLAGKKVTLYNDDDKKVAYTSVMTIDKAGSCKLQIQSAGGFVIKQ